MCNVVSDKMADRSYNATEIKILFMLGLNLELPSFFCVSLLHGFIKNNSNFLREVKSKMIDKYILYC